jgi:hypothetical protein
VKERKVCRDVEQIVLGECFGLEEEAVFVEKTLFES